MVGKVEILDSKKFDKFISKDIVIVDFYADWCGPCKIMAPLFEKLASNTSSVKFAKLNVDGNQEIAMRYGVMSIPTLILFKNSQPIDIRVGALNESEIVKMIKKIK